MGKVSWDQESQQQHSQFLLLLVTCGLFLTGLDICGMLFMAVVILVRKRLQHSIISSLLVFVLGRVSGAAILCDVGVIL